MHEDPNCMWGWLQASGMSAAHRCAGGIPAFRCFVVACIKNMLDHCNSLSFQFGSLQRVCNSSFCSFHCVICECLVADCFLKWIYMYVYLLLPCLLTLCGIAIHNGDEARWTEEMCMHVLWLIWSTNSGLHAHRLYSSLQLWLLPGWTDLWSTPRSTT